MATMARDPIAVVVGELMRMGKMPSAKDLKSGKISTSKLADLMKQSGMVIFSVEDFLLVEFVANT